jgi:hypothetical protein
VAGKVSQGLKYWDTLRPPQNLSLPSTTTTTTALLSSSPAGGNEEQKNFLKRLKEALKTNTEEQSSYFLLSYLTFSDPLRSEEQQQPSTSTTSSSSSSSSMPTSSTFSFDYSESNLLEILEFYCGERSALLNCLSWILRKASEGREGREEKEEEEEEGERFRHQSLLQTFKNRFRKEKIEDLLISQYKSQCSVNAAITSITGDTSSTAVISSQLIAQRWAHQLVEEQRLLLECLFHSFDASSFFSPSSASALAQQERELLRLFSKQGFGHRQRNGSLLSGSISSEVEMTRIAYLSAFILIQRLGLENVHQEMNKQTISGTRSEKEEDTEGEDGKERRHSHSGSLTSRTTKRGSEHWAFAGEHHLRELDKDLEAVGSRLPPTGPVLLAWGGLLFCVGRILRVETIDYRHSVKRALRWEVFSYLNHGLLLLSAPSHHHFLLSSAASSFVGDSSLSSYKRVLKSLASVSLEMFDAFQLLSSPQVNIGEEIINFVCQILEGEIGTQVCHSFFLDYTNENSSASQLLLPFVNLVREAISNFPSPHLRPLTHLLIALSGDRKSAERVFHLLFRLKTFTHVTSLLSSHLSIIRHDDSGETLVRTHQDIHSPEGVFIPKGTVGVILRSSSGSSGNNNNNNNNNNRSGGDTNTSEISTTTTAVIEWQGVQGYTAWQPYLRVLELTQRHIITKSTITANNHNNNVSLQTVTSEQVKTVGTILNLIERLFETHSMSLGMYNSYSNNFPNNNSNNTNHDSFDNNNSRMTVETSSLPAWNGGGFLVGGIPLEPSRDLLVSVFEIFHTFSRMAPGLATSRGRGGAGAYTSPTTTGVPLEGLFQVLSSALRCISGFAKTHPASVWELFLKQSLASPSFVDSHNSAGGRSTTWVLRQIFLNVECRLGRYSVTSAFLSLLSKLVKHFKERRQQTIQQQQQEQQQQHSRQQQAKSVQKVFEEFLPFLLYVRTDIVSTFSSWKYAVIEERWKIGKKAIHIFNRIMKDIPVISSFSLSGDGAGASSSSSEVTSLKATLLPLLVFNKGVHHVLVDVIGTGPHIIERVTRRNPIQGQVLEHLVKEAFLLLEAILLSSPAETRDSSSSFSLHYELLSRVAIGKENSQIIQTIASYVHFNNISFNNKNNNGYKKSSTTSELPLLAVRVLTHLCGMTTTTTTTTTTSTTPYETVTMMGSSDNSDSENVYHNPNIDSNSNSGDEHKKKKQRGVRVLLQRPPSLLAFLGARAILLRSELLKRLGSKQEREKMRLAILRFISTALLYQPGLAEMFIINVAPSSSSSPLSSTEEERDTSASTQNNNSSQSCLEVILEIVMKDEMESKKPHLLAETLALLDALYKAYPDQTTLLFNNNNNNKRSKDLFRVRTSSICFSFSFFPFCTLQCSHLAFCFDATSLDWGDSWTWIYFCRRGKTKHCVIEGWWSPTLAELQR